MKKLFINNLKIALKPHLKIMIDGMIKKDCDFCDCNFEKNELIAGQKESGVIRYREDLKATMGKELDKKILGFGVLDILNGVLIEILPGYVNFYVNTKLFGIFEFQILNENL